MLSSSVQNSEGRGDGNSGDSFADPCQEFKEGFFGVSSGLPLFKGTVSRDFLLLVFFMNQFLPSA
jgi:hypothetical protein